MPWNASFQGRQTVFCFDTFGGSFALALCSKAISLSLLIYLSWFLLKRAVTFVRIETLPGVQKGRAAFAQILAQPLNQYYDRKQVSSSRNFGFLVSEMQIITAHM